MMWLLSFVWTYWLWLILGLALVVGLSVIAYFFRNWKIVAAAAALVAVMLAIGIVDRRAYERRSQEVIDQMFLIAEQRQKIIDQLEQTDAAQRERNAAEIAKLQERLNNIPPNTDLCGDPDLPDRVGDIQ